MALFKVFRGQRNDLDNVTKVDGHAYFCTDDGSFWIDYLDGTEIKRKQVNDEDLKKSSLNLANGPDWSVYQIYTGEETADFFQNRIINEAGVCAVFGISNINGGPQTVMGGCLNTNEGTGNLIAGIHNQSIGKAHHNLQVGNGNYVAGAENGIIGGLYNQVAGDADNSLIIGSYNVVNTPNCIVGGIYNQNNPDALFQIGNGVADDWHSRSNAFQVLKDGRAKVKAAPVDNNDVVRKQDLDTSWANFNIKNGTGACSLVQSYTAELDPNPEAYANKATSPLAIALGEGSEASGPIAIAAGAAVKSTAICATSFGQNIENNAPAGFVVGQNNQTSSSATNAFVANQGNRASHLNSTVFGFHNNSTSENELVLGRYAYDGLHIIPEDAPFDKSATNTLLRVGYAFSDDDRSNLLELTDKYLALRGGIYSRGEIRANRLSGASATIDSNLTALTVNSNAICVDELKSLTTKGLNITDVKDLTTDYIKVKNNAQFENAPWIMAEPTDNYHAVNKVYVDRAIKNVQDTLVYATNEEILALWA